MKTIVINESAADLSAEHGAPNIVRPAVGSPYYIDPLTGFMAFLSPPGTKPVTSEDVRRELEDFP
jgi:hypothetical protein